MLLYIAQIVLAIYICVAVLMGGLIAMAVYRAGGWQGLTDQANMLGRGRATFTSNKVQNLCVFIVLCWPVVPFMVNRAVKRG